MSKYARILLITAGTTAAMALGTPAALAAPPPSVPNSGASDNCIATSSGLLFSQNNGEKLGRDVRQFAPHGGQAAFIQGQQTSCGGQAR